MARSDGWVLSTECQPTRKQMPISQTYFFSEIIFKKFQQGLNDGVRTLLTTLNVTLTRVAAFSTKTDGIQVNYFRQITVNIPHHGISTFQAFTRSSEAPERT